MDSDKTDIFDFGVILLEVVSGKTVASMYEVEILKELVCITHNLYLAMPTCERSQKRGRIKSPDPRGSMLQMQWAIADEDRVRRSFADPVVHKGCYDESLRTVMEICLRCLAKEPAQRPSVEDVLWNLQFAAQVQDDWEGDTRSSDGSLVSLSSTVTRSSRLSLSRC
jgi:hypothetical protein